MYRSWYIRLYFCVQLVLREEFHGAELEEALVRFSDESGFQGGFCGRRFHGLAWRQTVGLRSSTGHPLALTPAEALSVQFLKFVFLVLPPKYFNLPKYFQYPKYIM